MVYTVVDNVAFRMLTSIDTSSGTDETSSGCG